MSSPPSTPKPSASPSIDSPLPSAAGLQAPAPWLGEWWPRLRPWVLAAVGLALVGWVGHALQSLLHEVRYADVVTAMHDTSATDITLALLATALSYVALSGYDHSALRYAGVKLKGTTVLVTSFVAYALGNTIGLGALTGGAVRMRLYAAAGVEPPRITRVIVFNAAAFFLGMAGFAALGLLWAAPDVASALHLPVAALRAVALALLLVLGALLLLCARRRSLQVGRWRLRLPEPGLALRQLVISAVELSASAAALWFLLPDERIALPTFIAFYAIAVTAGLLSHVPGGVGVFEAVMLVASGPLVPPQAMLASLLLYRAIYFVLPLVLAAALLASYELRSGVAAPVGRIAVQLSPRLMAALALVAGLWLLVSGVTPQSDEAAELLAMRVPLPLIEASHFIGSVAGLGLLLVARGLLHRLDAAWWAALGLSIVAAILALPKGIALNEAALLTTLATLLVISRRQFTRPSSLFAQRLEPEWLLALGGVIAACTWILFFAYQEVDYVNRLWWQFEFDGQAPRSLRALTAVALIGLAFSLWQLFRPPAGELPPASAEEIERAAAIVRASPSAEGCFAFTGDKHLLFSPSGKSFLMFGKKGRSWVALFGPFGERREWAELVWRFVELAAAHGGRAAFYQVRPTALPLYLDCGLQAFKLGEHAHVPLHDFDLKGARRADLRSAVNRAQREGLSFAVLSPEQATAAMPVLREVSDAWLQQQKTREKSFSVGSFDEAYLSRTPIAVVRRGDETLAFANLLTTEAHDEACVDLMRYRPGTPPGTMDYLFAQVMLYLRDQGFQRFGLGMAPMAGMAERRRAPRWQRLGRLLYQHGERFYNFRGLHHFKDKFDPVWEPRYLAAPGGAAPVFALVDIAALVGGGVKGVVAK